MTEFLVKLSWCAGVVNGADLRSAGAKPRGFESLHQQSVGMANCCHCAWVRAPPQLQNTYRRQKRGEHIVRARCEPCEITAGYKLVFNSMESHGAFLVSIPKVPGDMRSDKPALLVYAKTKRRGLMIAFPGSYSEWGRIFGKTYVSALFVGGLDFVAQVDWQVISKLIKEGPSVNILTTSYTQAKETFKHLSENEYEADKKFAIKQLKATERHRWEESGKQLSPVVEFLRKLGVHP